MSKFKYLDLDDPTSFTLISKEDLKKIGGKGKGFINPPIELDVRMKV